MEAIIMAGGKGSRLWPLTENTPKPMVHLCGKPVLEYILDHLENNGCHKATLTLGFLPEVIRKHFAQNQYRSVKLDYIEESTPLGTAGGVANAAQEIQEDFLVLSGDALCNFNLQEAYQEHRRTGAAVTIVTTRVEDPREYGLVNVEAGNMVTGFTEKPSWSGVSTNLANTGIYVIHPHVLSMIPQNQSYDFAKDLFPKMLAKKMKIQSYEAVGYWCDIGDINSYRRCQTDLLQGQIEGYSAPDAAKNADKTYPEVKMISPVYLGSNVRLGSGSVIGPEAVIEDGTEIHSGASVKESIIMKNCRIGRGAKLQGAVLCSNTSIGQEAVVLNGSAIGEDSCLEEKCVVFPDVLVGSKQHIGPGERVDQTNKQKNNEKNCFVEDGSFVGRGSDLTAELCCSIGKAIGSLNREQRIGIGCENNIGAKGIYYAIMSGLISTGAQVLDFGRISKAGMSFAATFGDMALSVYVSSEHGGKIQLLENNGLPAGRDLQRQIEKIMNQGSYTVCAPSQYQDVADMSGISLLYQQEIYRLVPEGLVGIKATVRGYGREEERLFIDAFERLGGTLGGKPEFVLSADGCSVSAVDEHGMTVSPERMVALGSELLFKRGEDVVLNYAAPYILDTIAQKHGRRCIRMTHDKYNLSAKDNALIKKQYFLRDGMLLSFFVMSEMKKQGDTLSHLLADLPEVSKRVTRIPLHISPSLAMERIHSFTHPARQGRKIVFQDAVIRIWPDQNGKTLQLFTQAVNQETANELCAEVESKIRDSLDRYEEI